MYRTIRAGRDVLCEIRASLKEEKQNDRIIKKN